MMFSPQVMGTRPVPLVEDLPKLQYLDMVLCEVCVDDFLLCLVVYFHYNVCP